MTLSLVATIVRSGIAFVTGLLIARALGPGAYGTMMFLLGTAAAYKMLSDPGSSTAFFTFHAQRERSREFNRIYSIWLGAPIVLAIGAIALVPNEWLVRIWRGAPRHLIALAFLAAFAQMTVWATFAQMAEARRLTREAQLLAVCAVAAHLVLAAFAWWLDRVSVELVLGAVIVEWGIGSVLLSRRLHYASAAPGEDTPAVVLSEFWRFCAPFVPYAIIGFCYEFADRWLLQAYGGSAHQGYYAAAAQFGAVAAMANAAVINVYWKEMAEAHYQGRADAVARLHRRVTRGLFFVSAGISGLLVPWSAELVEVLLGPDYRGGVSTFAIMLFYPVHQTLGQVNGTTAFATQSVTGYVAIGSIAMLFGIVASYIALAPATAPIPGFGLASVGLALKMVLTQVVTVNVISYYLTRKLGLAFDWIYQPVVTVATIGMGVMSRVLSELAVGSQIVWLAPAIALVLYGLLLGSVIWSWPSLAGLSRSEVVSALRLAGIGRR